MASAVSLGSTARLRPESAQLRRGRGLDSLAKGYPRILQKLFAAQARFGDDFDRPILERLESALRALLGEARTDHDRYRMLGHDLLQERQPIHARHLDIQGDNIRHLFAHPLRRHKGVGSGPHDLDFRVAGEDFAECLSNHGGVVHDKNANFGCAHKLSPSSVDPVANSQRRDVRFVHVIFEGHMGEPAKPHFAGPRVELNASTGSAPQA